MSGTWVGQYVHKQGRARSPGFDEREGVVGCEGEVTEQEAHPELQELMAAMRHYCDVNTKPQYQGQFADAISAIAAVEAQALALIAEKDAEIERLRKVIRDWLIAIDTVTGPIKVGDGTWNVIEGCIANARAALAASTTEEG